MTLCWWIFVFSMTKKESNIKHVKASCICSKKQWWLFRIKH